jgi:eukaryotic-like serine/threonine-protein kinase
LETLPTRRERLRRLSPQRSGAFPARVGDILGQYRIVRTLGSGGMGAVYEAAHTESGKAVALKVLAADLASDSRYRARFLREAASASKIDHPNVVKVIDYGADQRAPFIVMQLLRGEDLGRRLNRSIAGLSLTEAVDTMLGICAGVFAAHQVGVVHRDLKPTNIFLARLAGDELSPKVLDFGISKIQDAELSASLTDPGAILGTTPYLSSEQVEGEEVDARADQYALGVVLYESLTGRRPYESENQHVLMRSIREGIFPPPSRLRSDLPSDLEAVILRALARQRVDRFPDVRALAAALFPFGSVKARARWADFCGGPATDPATPPASGGVQETGVSSLMLTVSASELPKGSSYQEHVGEDSPTETLHDARGSADTCTRQSSSLRQRRSTLSTLLLGTAVAIIVGGTVARLWKLPPRKSLTAREPVAPSPSPYAARRSDMVHLASQSPDGIEPTAVKPLAREGSTSQVVVDIVDAPVGLVVMLNGKEATSPIRLRRAPTPVTITFRAPGFETKRMSVGRSANQKLAIRMRRTETSGVDSGSNSHPSGVPRRRAGRNNSKPAYILKL